MGRGGFQFGVWLLHLEELKALIDEGMVILEAGFALSTEDVWPESLRKSDEPSGFSFYVDSD